MVIVAVLIIVALLVVAVAVIPGTTPAPDYGAPATSLVAALLANRKSK